MLVFAKSLLFFALYILFECFLLNNSLVERIFKTLLHVIVINMFKSVNLFLPNVSVS